MVRVGLGVQKWSSIGRSSHEAILSEQHNSSNTLIIIPSEDHCKFHSRKISTHHVNRYRVLLRQGASRLTADIKGNTGISGMPGSSSRTRRTELHKHRQRHESRHSAQACRSPTKQLKTDVAQRSRAVDSDRSGNTCADNTCLPAIQPNAASRRRRDAVLQQRGGRNFGGASVRQKLMLSLGGTTRQHGWPGPASTGK